MSLKINKIYEDSLAADSNLKIDDVILSINNQPINDFLDLQFHSADEELVIEVRDSESNIRSVTLNQNWEKPLGIEPIPHPCRTCANKCIFCFVDQMRPDIRDTLYIKDDDYRFSFVFGNFITLTNLSKVDLKRMKEQKLSPLYISVHTTNPDLHRKMLRYKHDFNIQETLLYLAEAGLEMHTQIVLIPGWNDRKELIDTLDFLTSEKLNTLSVGIVPVGLTRYRSSLTRLQTVDKQGAIEALRIAKNYPKVYCSDEIYILAGENFPDEEDYDGYPQLENGIGMMRMMLDNWDYNKELFLEDMKKINRDLVFISGQLAAPIIREIVDEINTQFIKNVRLVTVSNNFLGNSVTVTGLLAAKDIIKSTVIDKNEIAVVSAGIFNDDFLTIDNMSMDDLRDTLGGQLLAINEEFAEWELF